MSVIAKMSKPTKMNNIPVNNDRKNKRAKKEESQHIASSHRSSLSLL